MLSGSKRVTTRTPAGRRDIGRGARASVAIAAVGCVLAAVIWAPSASFGSTTPRCSTSNLRLELARTLGAAGARDWDLVLRNVGPHTCHLKGYPGVALLDRGAHVINVTVVRRKGTVREVILHAWQRSFFTLHFESAAPCPSGIFPAGLQVFPPNSAQQLRMYDPFGVCKGDHPDVTAVRGTLGGT